MTKFAWGDEGQGMRLRLNRGHHVMVLSALFLFMLLIPRLKASSEVDIEGAGKLIQTGRYEEAIDYLEKTRKGDPTNHEALLLLGRAYREIGKCKKAVEVYKKALTVNPTDSRALIGTGICYGNMGMKLEAVSVFEKVVEGEPNNALAHFYLGVAYERVRSMNKAWEQYETLKTLDRKLAEKLYKVIFW
ncbi:MAG: tetratricopeptide repeat protein [Deltaproteobacteria bacterium]|nr:tetratricopeptide repeat protein [Deltaproteobacteria bacterium]